MSPRDRSTHTPAAAPEVPDVPIRNIKSVTDTCQGAIGRALTTSSNSALAGTPNKWLRFEELESNQPRKSIWRLSGEGATEAVAQYNYSVVPFLTTQRTEYWLGASLHFDFSQGKHSICLTNVSLLVFQGLATDRQKRPVLRAEWDCTKDYRKNKHAQPHWHIYPSLLNQETDFSSPLAFQETNATQDFSPNEQANRQDQSTWTGGEKFHFAMAARWQAPTSEPQNEVLYPTKLGHWIERCLGHIKEELEYVDSKLSNH